MSLIRFYYGPLLELDSILATHFRPLALAGTRRSPLFRPKMDIHESKEKNAVTATFELPGMKPDDITIDVRQDRLTVAGEASQSRSHEEGAHAIRERGYGKFSRILQLPFATKPDDVKAKMEDGILTVTFPKTNPEQQAQRIAIQ